VCIYNWYCQLFSGSAGDLGDYKLFGGDKVFVLWNWIWVGDSSLTPPVNSPTSSLESPPNDCSTSEDDGIPAITHTIIFKCIGVTKEQKYQDTLKYAKKKLDDELPMKLQPEPDNKKDSNALNLCVMII